MNNDLKPLVARAQEGDISALENLMAIYRKKVYAFALTRMGNQADADDLAQEALIRIYTLLPSYDAARANFDTWVFRVTTNLCIDWSRRRGGAATFSLDFLAASAESEEIEWEPPDDRNIPEEEMEKKELREMAWRLMGELPPKSRAAVVLREIEGCSYKEIAALLGCSETAVKTRINRGREILKQKLVEAGYRPQVMRPKPKGE